jgi:hypothetical protein
MPGVNPYMHGVNSYMHGVNPRRRHWSINSRNSSIRGRNSNRGPHINEKNRRNTAAENYNGAIILRNSRRGRNIDNRRMSTKVKRATSKNGYANPSILNVISNNPNNYEEVFNSPTKLQPIINNQLQPIINRHNNKIHRNEIEQTLRHTNM